MLLDNYNDTVETNEQTNEPLKTSTRVTGIHDIDASKHGSDEISLRRKSTPKYF